MHAEFLMIAENRESVSMMLTLDQHIGVRIPGGSQIIQSNLAAISRSAHSGWGGGKCGELSTATHYTDSIVRALPQNFSNDGKGARRKRNGVKPAT
ncbi:MAG: hypothetical protein DMG96_38795 [Acidobacteria bacterium]|nr:MAG: hypothetical protein DMG96_38795 [Acidobacteriota bacterium]